MSNPPLVLIHGFRGAPIGLSEIARLLESAGYSVFSPAIPPFGGAHPLDNYTPAAYVNFLTHYLEQEGLEQPILIGHSMGSIITAAAAQEIPELLSDKIILMSPIPDPPAKPLRLVSPLSAHLPPKIVDEVTTRYLFVPKKSPELFQKTISQTHACTATTAAPKSHLRASAYFSAHHGVNHFTFNQKTLIISGERDRLIKQSLVEQLAKRQQAVLKIVPNSGHLHNYEQPQLTVDFILDFLKNY